MPLGTPNFIAGGTIAPARFVTMNPINATGTAYTVAQATAGTGTEGDIVFGISQEGSLAFNSTNAATVGLELEVHGPGMVAMLELGSGGATAGQLLKSDASGKGINAATNKDRVGAYALEAGSSGDKIRVFVHPQFLAV
jgi:hypothetical protein